MCVLIIYGLRFILIPKSDLNIDWDSAIQKELLSLEADGRRVVTILKEIIDVNFI